MSNTTLEARSVFIKEIFAVNRKPDRPYKLDGRKKRHKAPANHPWRQYKSSGDLKAV